MSTYEYMRRYMLEAVTSNLYYHGTTTGRLPDILKDGLKGGKEGRFSGPETEAFGGLYFTKSPQFAYDFIRRVIDDAHF